jgi:RNA recognition motif-containing protein
MIKLFVGGFPLDISELELVQLFNLHGDVETIKIVRDKKTKICKGYAFLEMKDQEGADRAIEALDNTPFLDRMLSVKKVVEPPTTTVTSKVPTGSQASKYIKVERPSGIPPKKRPRRQG